MTHDEVVVFPVGYRFFVSKELKSTPIPTLYFSTTSLENKQIRNVSFCRKDHERSLS